MAKKRRAGTKERKKEKLDQVERTKYLEAEIIGFLSGVAPL